MQYELAPLEKLIVGDPLTATPEMLREALSTENARICHALLDAACSHEQDDIVRRHIQKHQQALLRLAKRLEHKPAKADASFSVKIELLGRLLDELAEMFPDYWDLGLVMPAFQRRTIRESILSRQSILLAKIKNSKADKRLIGEVLKFKAAFLAEENPFTYKQWYQVREMVAFVEKLPDEAGEGLTGYLIDHLFRLGIHHESIFAIIQEKAMQDMGKLKSPEEKLSYLHDMQEHASGIRNFLDPHDPPEPGSLLALYNGWMAKMIRVTQRGPDAAPDGDLNASKINTSLSKTELALMVRLFLDTGIFKEKPWTDVARFMTAMVTTRNDKPGKNASFNNFYQLLFKVPGPTYKAVDQILDNMKIQLAALQTPAFPGGELE